jgi:uncharacterized protein with FMN-binding domain
MKKILTIGLPVLLVIIVAFYFIFNSQTPATVVAPTQNPTSTTGSGTTTTSGSGTYKDGTYQGPVTDAYYGNLQVAAVISGGKLTDVQFLQYPSDNGHSKELSLSSMPILKQEAITSQSANVSIVSGATQTSQAFTQSLAAALTHAKS